MSTKTKVNFAAAVTTYTDITYGPNWLEGVAEQQRTFPSLINSGVVVSDPRFSEIAEGKGSTANVTFFKDFTDENDRPQKSGRARTADIGMGKISNDKQVCVILNREFNKDFTAESVDLTGTDPIGFFSRGIAQATLKQRQKTLLAMLRGQFKTALAANRVSAFIEAGDLADDYLIDADKVIDAIAKLGERGDSLVDGGVFWVHPDIKAGLRKQDETNFLRTSLYGLKMDTYKGIPIFTSNSLVRAGVPQEGQAARKVYDSYLLSKASVGMGEKAQVFDQLGVASLQLELKKNANALGVYNRTRFVMHTGGLRWVGADISKVDEDNEIDAEGAEPETPNDWDLEKANNWQLAYQTADRVGVAQILTNG